MWLQTGSCKFKEHCWYAHPQLPAMGRLINPSTNPPTREHSGIKGAPKAQPHRKVPADKKVPVDINVPAPGLLPTPKRGFADVSAPGLLPLPSRTPATPHDFSAPQPESFLREEPMVYGGRSALTLNHLASVPVMHHPAPVLRQPASSRVEMYPVQYGSTGNAEVLEYSGAAGSRSLRHQLLDLPLPLDMGPVLDSPVALDAGPVDSWF